MSAAVPHLSAKRYTVMVVTAVLVLAASACRREPTRTVRMPLNPPWWQPAVPLVHSAFSAVLAGGFPLPGEDLDVRRLGYLRAYLAVLADGGPESTPELFSDQAHVIAYYLNAHMAWAHALGSAPALRGRPVDALLAEPIRVDRKLTTLAELAAKVRAEATGEPRVELFLNPGWRGGPRLPPSALEGYSLSWQLAAQAQRCGQAAGFWELHGEAHEVRLSALVADMRWMPVDPRLRTRRALDVVPPPPALGTAILSLCGEQLQRCSVRFIPIDRSRV
ncbi:MAG: hypothetical protein KA072_12530 [Thermoanaerobaculaceae bacterium]|nr:hypothetical protein [Thermoanaerobaculaceae bacterium]MDI9620272.1 hypothetical protein [Acidobacteriota bacterium]NLH11222.1 hypothetical protein [Holophagae bacterium]HPW56469.1 hypothetical protein [Thermoanaerobaculaceae bacterium]